MLFFHGLESGPHGSKFRALQAAFGDVVSPDFTTCGNIYSRLVLADEITRNMDPQIIVGSSFGGLLAALFAHHYPERVLGYVLCAPAFHRDEADVVQHVPRAFIIHGRQDDVVPLLASDDFAMRHNVPLLIVNDDHRLSRSHDLMIMLVHQIQSEAANAA